MNGVGVISRWYGRPLRAYMIHSMWMSWLAMVFLLAVTLWAHHWWNWLMLATVAALNVVVVRQVRHTWRAIQSSGDSIAALNRMIEDRFRHE